MVSGRSPVVSKRKEPAWGCSDAAAEDMAAAAALSSGSIFRLRWARAVAARLAGGAMAPARGRRCRRGWRAVVL